MKIDLRSDTVTRPTPAMRDAMASAEVGDDVYGEDPTMIRLEEEVAKRFGKEAALFVPSGTMGNQIGLWLHTQPGDEVLVGEGAHCMIYESGAAAALSGLQFQVVGQGGLFTAAAVEAAIRPGENPHNPPTRLVVVENTHNRSGGRIFSQLEIWAIAEVARRKSLALHLDGARIWNAHAATGLSLSELAAPFSTLSVCLSKGLGAPVGSLLCGSKAAILRARRRRKMLGGGMRQIGMLAAAGLYALEHHLPLLKQDHVHARALAGELASIPGLVLRPEDVETNIVIWELAPEVPLDAAKLVERARSSGLLINAIGPRRVRAVTHFEVSRSECVAAASILRTILKSS
jgi:threonine aldolase